MSRQALFQPVSSCSTNPKAFLPRFLWNLGLTDRLRRCFFWRWACRYFPVTLRPTAALPPEKGPYIFVCHPHGIIGVSPMTSFGTDASGFSEAFPGIQVHLLGHNAIFRIPLFRASRHETQH